LYIFIIDINKLEDMKFLEEQKQQKQQQTVFINPFKYQTPFRKVRFSSA